MSVVSRLVSDHQSFTVQSASGSYEVVISPSLMTLPDDQLSALGINPQHVMVICDERFETPFQPRGWPCIALTSDEQSKELTHVAQVLASMRKLGANRQTILLAVGGGVVQDVSAFCAAVFMRGIKWMYWPTTLLSMADSCIGGKSSINVGHYKNLVGSFNPPDRICIDPTLVSSLSPAQLAAGLLEAAKITFCRGEDVFTAYLHQSVQPDESLRSFVHHAERVGNVIDLSLRAKQWFIEIDEFDRAERLCLNFGHTFGHALESASSFGISHGIAVGVGMLCAIQLAESTHQGLPPRVQQLKSHMRQLLDADENLQVQLSKIDAETFFTHFESDKKHKRDAWMLAVVNPLGKVELMPFPKTDENRDRICQAYLRSGLD